MEEKAVKGVSARTELGLTMIDGENGEAGGFTISDRG